MSKLGKAPVSKFGSGTVQNSPANNNGAWKQTHAPLLFVVVVRTTRITGGLLSPYKGLIPAEP